MALSSALTLALQQIYYGLSECQKCTRLSESDASHPNKALPDLYEELAVVASAFDLWINRTLVNEGETYAEMLRCSQVNIILVSHHS